MRTRKADSCIEAFITKQNPLKELAVVGDITEALITGMRCPLCQEKVGCSHLEADDGSNEGERFYQYVHLCLNGACDWFEEQTAHSSSSDLISCPFCYRKLS